MSNYIQDHLGVFDPTDIRNWAPTTTTTTTAPKQSAGSRFLSLVKAAGGGALDIAKSDIRSQAQADLLRQQAAARQPRAAGGMPGWVIPVGIGAAGLVLFLALKKKS